MIGKLKLLYNDNRFPFISLFILGAIAWFNPDTFLWRDDWLYLSFYYQGNYGLFNGHLAAEIKPLFQYLLFTEFYFYGSSFALYQAVNTVLLILLSCFFFSTTYSFGINRNITLCGAMLFLLHPTNFVNALWIFQQCELFHLLFLLLSILYFNKYIENNNLSALLLFGLFLFLQNCFFPNGVFYPILFLLIYFLSRKTKSTDWKFITAAIFIFCLLLAHAFYIQTKVVSIGGATQDLILKFIYFNKLISTTILRVAIPNFSPQPLFIINFIIVCSLAAFIWFIYKSTSDPRKRMALLTGSLGLIFSSIILTLTRYNQPEIHYYYTSLHFPFLFLILCVIADHYVSLIPRLAQPGAVIVLLVFIVLDFKGKNIFANRNIQNIKQMDSGATANKYIPFDDPSFEVENYFTIDHYSQSESAVILYQWLSSDQE